MKKVTNLVLIVGFILFTACGGKNETVKPIRKDLIQAVYASGKVFPLGYYKLLAKFPGYIKRIYVKPGDHIKKGDTLIVVKNDQAELSEETAKNILNFAQKNASANSDYLSIYENDLNAVSTKLKLDSLNFVRYSQLLKENATSQIQYDQSKVQFEISKSNYYKAVDALNNVKDKTGTEAENARINYEVQIATKSDFVIIAERDGKIFNIDVRVGELVNAQKMLLEVGQINGFEVELNIDETDVELVKPGQKIIYEADAFRNNEKFEGEVVTNYLSINPVNKTAKVISSIQFAEGQSALAGMSVEANIIIEKRQDVLVIPRDYLFDYNKVKVKGKDQPIIIKKGIEDLEFIEITEGLSETDELINPAK